MTDNAKYMYIGPISLVSSLVVVWCILLRRILPVISPPPQSHNQRLVRGGVVTFDLWSLAFYVFKQ